MKSNFSPVKDIDQIRTIAEKIRIDIIRSLVSAGSGHIGGSLGLTDIFTALYFNFLLHNPSDPTWEDRDRLILSIGHVAPALYASLAHSGYFPVEELLTLRKLGSRLQGHPGKDHGLPGLEISSGSLGQGLSVAVGIALSGKIKAGNWRVVTILGDGELQEGSVWESAMSASHHKLDNLIAIVDRNYLQIDGATSEVMEIEPLADKWLSFGWEIFSLDGNNIEEIITALWSATKPNKKPKVLIANTTMGKGVKEIENNYFWHGKAPTEEEGERFIKQILNYG